MLRVLIPGKFASKKLMLEIFALKVLLFIPAILILEVFLSKMLVPWVVVPRMLILDILKPRGLMPGIFMVEMLELKIFMPIVIALGMMLLSSAEKYTHNHLKSLETGVVLS